MKKLKEDFKKIANSKYFPFFILAIVMFIIHLFTYSNGDDDFFRVQLDNYNLFEYLIMRYETWSSRVFVETLFVIVTRLPLIVWMILDTIIYTCVGIVISKIFNKKNEINKNWIITGLMLVLPFTDMVSAGYVCTTIAYIWTTAALLYDLYLIKKINEGEKVKWFQYILSFICLLVVISFEQTLCLLIGFLSLAIFNAFYQKKIDFRNKWMIYVFFIISVAMLIITLACPGNAARTASSIEYWYPEYANFGIPTKIYLGIIPTFAVLLNNKTILTLFSIILCICVFNKCKNKGLRILAVIQAAFFTLLGALYNITLSIFPSIGRLWETINIYNVVPKLEFDFIIPLVLFCIMVVTITILLYYVFNKKLLVPIIFLASFASRFIIGFSATVFASVDRTAFFMYVGLIVIIYAMLEKITKSKTISYINYSLLIISIFNVLNIIYTLIIVRG